MTPAPSPSAPLPERQGYGGCIPALGKVCFLVFIRQTAPDPKPARHGVYCPCGSHRISRLARAGVYAAVLAIGTGSGCMTTFQARKARAGVAELRVRLDALEDVDGEHAKQIPDLSRALEEARALLVASADDAAAKEDRTETDLANLQVRLDQLDNAVARGTRERAETRDRVAKRLAALEQTDAQLAEKIGLSLPEDKEQLWRQATALLASGQREQGRRYFEAFIQRFPQDSRASEGLLAIGLSYAEEARLSNAAATFQQLLSTYPDSPDAPEAMWQLSRAFGEMAFCKDERALLRNLVERYPKSRPAVDATKALNSPNKHSSDACVS